MGGFASPIIANAMGKMTDIFDPTKSPEEIMNLASSYALYLLIAGVVIFIMIVIGFSTWVTVGER